MKTFVCLFCFILLSLPAFGSAQETSATLPDVVVSATRVEEPVQDVAQDVTVLTAQEIKRDGFSTITGAIASVMGVQVNEYGNRGSIATASIRGATSAQVLILIDGKRLNLPSTGQFDLNDLPITLDDVERIEVVRGASSALYGADAMGGVINIITKNPGKPVTSLSASYGSSDTRHISAYSSRQAGVFGYVLSTEKETSDGFMPNTDYDLWNLDGKVTLKLSKDANVVFNANYEHKEEGVPGEVDYPTPDAREHDENELFGIGLNIKKMHLNLYSHKSGLHYWDPLVEDDYYRTGMRGADIQDSFLLGSSNLVTAGGEIVAERLNSNVVGIKNRTTEGVFAQDQLIFTENLIATAGLRYDNYDLGSRVTPRVSALYRPFAKTTFRISAGMGYRVPTFEDLYWPNTGYAEGNPNLKPEKSKEYEISFEQMFGKSLTAKALAFHKNVEDLIQWEELPSGMWMPENIDQARINGIEFDANYVFKNIALSLSYYYQDPKDENTGENIPYLPRQNVKGNISYETKTGLIASLEGNYVSNYVTPGSPSWSYYYLNGKISQKVPLFGGRANGEIFLEGKNILDNKYQIVQGYPMPPAAVTGGVRISF